MALHVAVREWRGRADTGSPYRQIGRSKIVSRNFEKMSFWRLEGCGRGVGGDFVRDWFRFGAKKLKQKRFSAEWHHF